MAPWGEILEAPLEVEVGLGVEARRSHHRRILQVLILATLPLCFRPPSTPAELDTRVSLVYERDPDRRVNASSIKEVERGEEEIRGRGASAARRLAEPMVSVEPMG